MEKIKSARLPGFYTDERGAYGIVLNGKYICCFVNIEDGKYDVTVDTIDENGDFALNLDWESYENPMDAINALRKFVRRYGKQ